MELKNKQRFLDSFCKPITCWICKAKLNSKSEFMESKNICQLQKIYVLKDASYNENWIGITKFTHEKSTGTEI